MKIQIPTPDAKLLAALEKKPLRLYYLVPLGTVDYSCGVVGDGANGLYEWFVWRDGKLKISDLGYGSPEAALRAVLNEVT